MAVTARAGEGRTTRGVVFHSDRGSEYTAATFDTACQRLGVIQSMGRVGSALDNAAAEAVNSTIKVELVHRAPRRVWMLCSEWLAFSAQLRALSSRTNRCISSGASVSGA